MLNVNVVTFFKHHRWVEHRNGEKEFKLAPVRKSIYSLRDLTDLMGAANRRYLAFMADIDDPTAAPWALTEVDPLLLIGTDPSHAQ